MRRSLLFALLALTGCSVAAPSETASVTALGTDGSGLACTQQAQPGGEILIYCGDLAQPSGRIVRQPVPGGVLAGGVLAGGTLPGGMLAGGTLAARLAEASPWRRALDLRFECRGAVEETLLDAPASRLDCVRRVSGWPRVAIVAVLGDTAYLGDADPAAALVLRRGIGVASGRLAPQGAQEAASEDVAARRAVAQAVSSRDIRHYDALMTAGVRANLTENFAAAETAYRQAAALLLRFQGPDAPTRADPLLHQALQLSNLGRIAESEAVFTTAARLIETARLRGDGLPDDTLAPRLALYRGLSLLNQDRPREALDLFTLAERGYAPLAPPGTSPPPGGSGPRGLEAAVAGLAEAQLFQDPVGAAAVLGLVSTRRGRAVALLRIGRVDDSRREAQSAQDTADSHGMAKAALEARILRTSAMIAQAGGEPDRALSLLTRSVAAFNQVFPTSRPVAETQLLRAANLFRAGQPGGGLAACRAAIALLQRLSGGVAVELMMSCLDAMADAADHATSSDSALGLRSEMFAAAQLAQTSITSTQIAQAAVRLSEAQRDTRVGQAIRDRDTAAGSLEKLYRERDLAEQAAHGGAPRHGLSTGELDAAVERAETMEADADAALGSASPNYRQLVESVVTASDVFAGLRPEEALATMVLGEDHGWTLVLRAGQITTVRIAGGRPRMLALVTRIRASMQPGADGLPPPFDTGAASDLHAAVFGPARTALAGIRALVVAPAGALLSIPFGLLLTGDVAPGHRPVERPVEPPVEVPVDVHHRGSNQGPAQVPDRRPDQGPARDYVERAPDLRHAPWLIRQMTVSHVPAPASFVALRRAPASAAAKPWAGFADPVPLSPRQALAIFPSPDCRRGAELLAGLPRLPGARSEIELVRRELDGSPRNALTGAALNRAAVERLGLRDFRVLHFATHGLLPTDLACQSEPAILLSAPDRQNRGETDADVANPSAASAGEALLTASRVAQWDLDADIVVLSACNTSGPDGRPAGESLSGLARSFFFAGTRSLMVTHWPVNDRVTAVLVAGTIGRWRQAPDQGLAAALAGQQLALLEQASGEIAALAHPFYWAPLALIGEGRGRLPGSRAAHAGL